MIAISEIINVSVSTPPAGIAEQNMSNLACFSRETPLVSITEGYRVYTSATDVSTDFGSASETAKAANYAFAATPNIITGGGKFIVVIVGPSESSETALARIMPTVFFGAFATVFTELQAALLATGVAAKAAGKIFAVASSTGSDLDDNGLCYEAHAAGLTNMRCLFHNDATQAKYMKWSYLSRAMSVNFNGNNTTNTMQLKQLPGVAGDTALTETQKGKAKAIGCDVYPVIAGRSSVLSYGANEFFDYVFNLAWAKMALEVAGFNLLAQTSTKLPQTEAGMDLLKGVYRSVCERAVANGMVAAGSWTSPDTFGDPEDFHRCIKERGYFIYSSPVSAQSTADRDARNAPLVQIAFKMAGAVHHSDVLVNINK
jgi:hypothetical protein